MLQEIFKRTESRLLLPGRPFHFHLQHDSEPRRKQFFRKQ